MSQQMMKRPPNVATRIASLYTRSRMPRPQRTNAATTAAPATAVSARGDQASRRAAFQEENSAATARGGDTISSTDVQYATYVGSTTHAATTGSARCHGQNRRAGGSVPNAVHRRGHGNDPASSRQKNVIPATFSQRTTRGLISLASSTTTTFSPLRPVRSL